jgi:hypothetical protein
MRTATILFLGFLVTAGLCRTALAGDAPETGSIRPPGWSSRERRGFDLEVLIASRRVEPEYRDGHRLVRAVEGAEYELWITNPLPDRVAVALSVDGLNTVDARSTDAWDAGKWLIRPYQSLTVTGWQVGTERARRFYFTREADSYASRLGRPAEYGVIRAVFFRERRAPIVIGPRPLHAWPAPREARDSTEAGLATDRQGRAESWRRDDRPWRDPGRAATGIGRSERSEVDVVDMALEREPVAEVVLRYDFRPPWHPPVFVPRTAPAPHVLRFSPEP